MHDYLRSDKGTVDLNRSLRKGQMYELKAKLLFRPTMQNAAVGSWSEVKHEGELISAMYLGRGKPADFPKGWARGSQTPCNLYLKFLVLESILYIHELNMRDTQIKKIS